MFLPRWLWRRRRRRWPPGLRPPPGWVAARQPWFETTDWPGSRNLQSTGRPRNLPETSRKKNKPLQQREKGKLQVNMKHRLQLLSDLSQQKQFFVPHFSNIFYLCSQVSFFLMSCVSKTIWNKEVGLLIFGILGKPSLFNPLITSWLRNLRSTKAVSCTSWLFRSHVSNSRPGGQIRPLVDLISARRIIFNYY